MKRFTACLIAVLSASLFVPAARATTIYDPQPVFTNSNPNGVWSYGTISPSSVFTPFVPTDYVANNGASGVNSWGTFPGIFDNTNAGTTTIYTTIAIPGQTLVLHPPDSANQVDLRFTAPTNLIISNVAATFAAADTGGTSSDVHVYVNGLAVFDSNVDATAGGGTTSYNSGPLVLLAGQTVDFRVGDVGLAEPTSPPHYYNDGTTLVASITAVPEPSSIALLCLGGLTLVGVRIKRLRRKV